MSVPTVITDSDEYPQGGRKSGKPTTRLETVFLTGPGGRVYELPREVAEQYAISMDRLKELAHLPITPYGVSEEIARRGPSTGNGGRDVQGRHLVMLANGTMGYHSDVQYGAFLFNDGHTYVGDHYHPYGTELGFTP